MSGMLSTILGGRRFLQGEDARGSRLKVEYWMDNWTVSDVTGHAGVIGQYLANAIISEKSK